MEHPPAPDPADLREARGVPAAARTKQQGEEDTLVAYDRRVGGHEVAQADRPDYRLVVGRAEIPVGAPRGYAVLDPARAATLEAWVATLIPAAGSRPDAARVGAAQYIDATLSEVAALRPALLQAVDRVELLSATKAGRPFEECAPDERERLLREFEAADDTDTFNMVRDFTYEAYYGHPDVLAALERDTGFRGLAQATGTSLRPFDETRLARVKTLPPRWRQTVDGEGA